MKKFIDFDKHTGKFYCNYYLNEYKFVIKTSLNNNGEEKENIKFDTFDLTKYTYLLHFD